MMNLRKIIKQSINESEELGWIQDIPNTPPSMNNRATISWEEFMTDIMESDEDLKQYLIDGGYYNEEDGDWERTPYPSGDWELMESLDYIRNNDKWELIEGSHSFFVKKSITN